MLFQIHFIKKRNWMENKHMEIRLTSAMRKMQIKATMRYFFNLLEWLQ